VYTVFDKLNSLPVFSLLDGITSHAMGGGIGLVTSETGSGKTLLVPLAIQKQLYESWNSTECVYVLQPRRFLAINAAETLASLTGTNLGYEFGYLVGTKGSGEENRYTPGVTKVCFVSYGYALATGLIMEANHLVFDEVHEQSIDMAICKAMIEYRYREAEPPQTFVLMSATLDAEREQAYWDNVSNVEIFSASTGRKYKCNRVHMPATPSEQAALSLLDDDYRGVLVFAPGVAEIEDIVDKMKKMISLHSEAYQHLIIATVHGQSDYAERRDALSAPPAGWRKILVGTNVIESGMNLNWVDSGVDTGLMKELHVRPGSGAVVLATVPIARPNCDQRSGRTHRFCESKYIICGENNYDQMAPHNTPEIERLPLTALYMHCQGIGLDPRSLNFLPQPDPAKMIEAEQKLKKLGLMDQNLKFTDAGKFAQNLPVGLETAAMLWHASQLGILADVIPLAAVNELGSMRKDHAYQHGFDDTSDLLDGLLAYTRAYLIQTDNSLMRDDRIELMEADNIGMRRYTDAVAIVRTLEFQLGMKANLRRYIAKPGVYTRPESYNDLRQCILAASLCSLGMQSVGQKGGIVSPIGTVMAYSVAKGSCVSTNWGKHLVAAKLRQIQPRNSEKQPFTVAEQITQFSDDVVKAFSEVRPGVFTQVSDHMGVQFFVNGVLYDFKKQFNFEDRYEHHGRHNRRDDRFFDDQPTLGDALTAALRKKAAGRHSRF
jgi:HrpA-like RNA helicase